MAKCYFPSGNTAIADAQKASWICFYAGYFNIMRTAWDTEDRKFSWRENGYRKIGESGINFWLHSLHPLLLFVTFAMNSFPLPKGRIFWMVYNPDQNISDKLFFCETAPYGKSSISIFQEFFASIDKILILGAALSTRL